uniref:Uncharacterized protein n=1 Tax=Vespula pensylvanica TaxID=30213 RepID=A0A834JUN1_VESPE|nr:hypothetical protein H0235_017075 [Vespula pensylvanica]
MILLMLIRDSRVPNMKFGRPGISDKQRTSEKQSLDGKSHFIFVHSEGKQKDCAVCSSRKISGERRETNFFFCEMFQRKPGLHPGNCFKR